MSQINNENEHHSTDKSNEQIIEEITKDIKEDLFLSNGETTNIESNNESISQGTSIPPDFEDSDNSEDVENTDDADELILKDLEITLTLEEKNSRQKEATDLKNKGNEEFKNMNYQKSIELYSKGLKICPLEFKYDRAILYANRAACKMKLDKKTLAVQDCTKALEFDNKYLKVYLRRAKLLEDTEKLEESLEDYKQVLNLDPGNQEALSAQSRLPGLINERNEKMKDEMLGKLKDLGNVILRPFGLSTENFQLQQDPNSGGYSINFKQNK